MDYRTNRLEDVKPINNLEVWIGDIRYTISESVSGNLRIRKYSENREEEISIIPKTTNVIEIK